MRYFIKTTLAGALSFIFTSCVSDQKPVSVDEYLYPQGQFLSKKGDNIPLPENIKSDESLHVVDEGQDLEKNNMGENESHEYRLREFLSEMGFDSEEAALQDPYVQKWIQFFSQKRRDLFSRYRERGAKYRGHIEKTLEMQGVPKHFYYLAMIESGFSTHAHSRAKAVGVWQFIAATGRRYGLKVDSHCDERRDPRRATVAAALYLKDLYRVYQSWPLAVAAYNSGEYRVLSAIMKAKSRQYQVLQSKKALPKETRNYVPKIVAAALIGENAEKYGFDPVQPHEIDAEMQHVFAKVPSPVRLQDVSKYSGISYETLKEMNPHLRKGVTTYWADSYNIWVPKKDLEKVSSLWGTLASSKLKGSPAPAVASGRVYHTIRRGETLSQIARRYGRGVSSLKKINGLHSSRIVAGRKILISSGHSAGSVIKYRVRRGDSLHQIASRYGMSLNALKQLNNLKRNRIYAGQILKVKRST